MLAITQMPQNDGEELGKLPELFRHYRFHAQPAQGGSPWASFWCSTTAPARPAEPTPGAWGC